MAVQPFEQYPTRSVQERLDLLAVVRDPIVTDVSSDLADGCPDHLSSSLPASGSSCPLLEISQLAFHSLSACAALDLEVSIARASTVVLESQKRECFRFLTLLLCRGSGIAAKHHISCLFLRQFQPESFQAAFQKLHEPFGIVPVLETRHEIIRITEVVCFPPAGLLESNTEPCIQHVVQVDI